MRVNSVSFKSVENTKFQSRLQSDDTGYPGQQTNFDLVLFKWRNHLVTNVRVVDDITFNT